jgi:DNA-binding response OmpR family regulator
MTRRSRIHRSKARILLVDDEPEALESLQELLVSSGFDVETAEDGKKAMDFLTKPLHFDLMITDMKMPGIDGLELLREVRGIRKDLPVVILTGCGTVENGIESLEQGAFDYVLKPFDLRKLMRVVRAILEAKDLTLLAP